MTLLANLERAARRRPDQVVLVDATRTLTYQQLFAAIDLRTESLQDGRGVGARVGVLLQPSVELVITYFACLRAGMVFTPLSRLPAPVMAKVLALLRLDVLVTDEATDFGVPTVSLRTTPPAPPASPPNIRQTASRTAHILLTSGTSTGSPKAVTTDQIGSLHSHAWRTALMPYRPDDAVGCNIFGIWDVVPALFNGVPAVMIPDAAMRDPLSLAAVLVRHAITRLMVTPTLLAACLNSTDAADALRKLRWLVLCGERVTDNFAKRVRRALPGVAVLNLYSTAECADVAAAPIDDDGEMPALEVADFARVVIADVDQRERLLPVGRPGRILVAGPGLASGYVAGAPGQSVSPFFTLAGAPWGDARVYDTGDLGVLTADGRLRVLGRCDDGIKIRGAWVNPEHVADVLTGHPDVADVSVREADGKLVAFVVPTPSAEARTLASDLRSFATTRLAAHAVPGRIETVSALPLASSGKADRRAVPAVAPARTADLEREVLAAFRRVLNDPTVTRNDDFIDRGGDSLSAIALCGILQQRTGRRIRVADFLRHSRPAALAAFIAKGARVSEVKDWRLPQLAPELRIGSTAPSPMTPPRTVLVTGASGYIGRAFVDAVRGRFEVLALIRSGKVRDRTAIQGDLTEPGLGLPTRQWLQLGRRIDAIIHIAANVDAFASYDDLAPLNAHAVEGLIRLAAERAVPLVHVSSSAIFPLGDGERKEATPEVEGLLARRLAASGADAYSRTKLAAEALLQQAAARGLSTSVVRIPHLLGHPRNDRLASTLKALIAAGVFPDVERGWRWQFTTRDVVCRALVDALRTRPSVRHATLAPITGEQVFDCLTATGFALARTTLPAIATALDQVSPSHRFHTDATVLGRLISEYGPRAALSMDDAILLSAKPADVAAAQILRRHLSQLD